MLPVAEVVVLCAIEEVEDGFTELDDSFDVVKVVAIDELLVELATDVAPGIH